MSRFEFRWARRHPSRWLSLWWPVLAISISLAAIAILWTDDTFQVVRWPNLWPVVLSVAATLVAVTTIVPFSRRLAAIAGGSLVTIGVLRVIGYIDALLTADAGSSVDTTRARYALAALAVHWVIVSLVGVVLPTLVAEIATRVTVEAGSDDRGSLPATDDRGGQRG